MKYTKKQWKQIRLFRNWSVVITSFLLVIGMIMGALFFIRPTESIVEKRKLTAFPAFHLSTFLDGSYFSDVSKWYSDTFPGRDRWIAMSQDLKKSYGIESNTRMVGGNAQKDTIPSNGTTSNSTSKTAKAPKTKDMQAEVQNQIMEGLYVKDGADYSVYYFDQSAANTYTKAMNRAAKELKGTTSVYSVLVPNNSGAMLDDKTLNSLGGSDQQEGIDYYADQYSKNVHMVNILPTLRKHNDQYLYFRTDHHWTSLGAYYAYKDFCKEKGITAHKLSYFKKSYKFSPFLGTFYDKLKDSAMEKNPDYVKAYVPNGTNDLTYWDESGQAHDWHVIEDVSSWNEGSGYYCFIGGDKPLTKIENPKIKDGSSCVVVKESYGNCFVPYLVDHYQTVYIMDFRYTKEKIVSFCKKNKIQDLIMINNITIIASKDVASKIDSELH